MKNFREYDLIYSVIMSIPRGKVATYGQIAEIAGLPGHARQVGYALRVLPENSAVPWHRVINARGEVSRRPSRDGEWEQRKLLEAEGVVFSRSGRVALSRFRWLPRGII
jgi:methylated-DNA-protein-cysteine methyltransferase-like protein